MSRLGADSRGAIALMGLLMAVFLAGCLYYVMGIGEAIVQRERMQDAADAAAWGAATLHARGMNLLVLINMTMAALMAILVALKLVEAVIIALLVAVGVASFLFPGASTAIPELTVLHQRVRTAHDQAKRVVDPTLEALRATAHGVRAVVPWATQVRVVQQARAHFAPPAYGAVAIPTRTTLPVEDDAYATLCERASDYTGDLVRKPLARLPGVSALGGLLDEAIEGLAGGNTSWFCGVGAPPRKRVTERIGYPKLPARAACERALPGGQDPDLTALDSQCRRAEEEERRAAFDRRTGECLQDCGPDGPYALRDRLARSECDPNEHPRRRDYVWQQRRVRYRIEHVRGRLVRSIEGEPLSTVRHGGRAPCRRETSRGHTHDWNRIQYELEDVTLPVCSEGDPFPQQLAPGAQAIVERDEVLRVFGCEERRQRVIEVGTQKEQPTDAQAKRRAPQRLVKDAVLGGEDFQLRGLALGALPREAPEHAVAVASWGDAPEQAEALRIARKLGRVAAAQAEYYFHDASVRHDPRFMWEMSWVARLRRLRIPERGSRDGDARADDGGDARTATTLERACDLLGVGGSLCSDGIDAISSELSELAIH